MLTPAAAGGIRIWGALHVGSVGLSIAGCSLLNHFSVLNHFLDGRVVWPWWDSP